MTKPPILRILIDTAHEAAAGRWAVMLRGPGAEVWTHPADVPPGGRADVVVTDAAARETPLFGWGDAAVVEIGSGDVEIREGHRTVVGLPDDVTGRELRLACRLLGRIVTLRRQQHREARLRRRLAEEASTDPLTGLPNRRAWDAVLGERLRCLSERPDTGRGPMLPPCPALLCVAVVDLDHFKPVNDAHGHATGDAVLRCAARALREGLRPDDFVARLGGDEFALLLEVPDAATAASVIDRVRRRIPPALSAAGQPVVTASAGYQVVPPPSEPCPASPTPESLLAAADAALRQAKQQGRDRTVEAR